MYVNWKNVIKVWLILVLVMLPLVACNLDNDPDKGYNVDNIALGITKFTDKELGVVCYDTTHGVDCLTFKEIYGDN